MGFVGDIVNGLSIGYKELIESVSYDFSGLLNVFIFAILIALYSLFTWKFYRYISKKDLIDLNLQQYNRTTHPFLNKLVAILFYLIEYIIILPFLIFFWFAILALMILLLSEELAASQVIIISAAIVGAIRMLAYYEEELAKELAKVFPFTIIAIFIINPSFFTFNRLLTNLKEVPNFLGKIVLFLILIVGIELILRIVDTILNLFRSEVDAEINSDDT